MGQNIGVGKTLEVKTLELKESFKTMYLEQTAYFSQESP